MRNPIILLVGISLAIVVLSIILCLSLAKAAVSDDNLQAETIVQENDDNSSPVPVMQDNTASINDTVLISAGGSLGAPTVVPMVTTVPEYHPVTIQSSSPSTQTQTTTGKTRHMPPKIPTRPDGE